MKKGSSTRIEVQIEQRAKMESAVARRWTELRTVIFESFFQTETVNTVLHIQLLTLSRSRVKSRKSLAPSWDVTEHELPDPGTPPPRSLPVAEAQKTQSPQAASDGNLTQGEIVWSDGKLYRIFEYDHSVKPSNRFSDADASHPQDRADFQKVIDGASRGSDMISEHTYQVCCCLTGESSTSTRKALTLYRMHLAIAEFVGAGD